MRFSRRDVRLAGAFGAQAWAALSRRRYSHQRRRRTRSSASATRNTATSSCSRTRARSKRKLAALGYKIVWSEFPFGPPLLEALNAGAIDFGHAGEAPPMFAQAAAAQFVYVAHEPPAPNGEAILVPKDSPIKSVADLKGKKVASTRARTSTICWSRRSRRPVSITPTSSRTFLAPADARAAFESGKVDAW